MVILGNHFRGSIESDWMMKTSIRYETGANTKKILQEILKENNVEKEKKISSKECQSSSSRPSSLSNNIKLPKAFDGVVDVEQDKNVHSTRRKNNGGYIFENFDESQHLNGCPLKWLYFKKLSERNAAYLVRRSCSKKSGKKEEAKKQNKANVRDKTPIEVKIHKINLMERSDMNYWKQSFIDEPDIRREIEIHRRNLAAKLNWKLHDDTPDDSGIEISSQLSFRYNYLHPRPLWGLKPLLSILLLPHQETSCCPSKIQIQPNYTREEPTESPSLSIKSLELPLVKTEEESPSRINSRGRWGSKSHRSGKKLQIPNQITINLRRKHNAVKPKTKNKNRISVSNAGNASLKKSSDKAKQAKENQSLSSLFYELSYKTNYKNETNEHLEDLIRNLTVEDEKFKFQRFFRYNVPKKNSEMGRKGKHLDEKKNKQTNYRAAAEEKSKTVNFQCGKVRFFQRLGESRYRK